MTKAEIAVQISYAAMKLPFFFF